jgi:hypothetical protein
MQQVTTLSKREVRRILTDPSMPMEAMMAMLGARPCWISSAVNLPEPTLRRAGCARQWANASARGCPDTTELDLIRNER